MISQSNEKGFEKTNAGNEEKIRFEMKNLKEFVFNEKKQREVFVTDIENQYIEMKNYFKTNLEEKSIENNKLRRIIAQIEK